MSPCSVKRSASSWMTWRRTTRDHTRLHHADHARRTGGVCIAVGFLLLGLRARHDDRGAGGRVCQHISRWPARSPLASRRQKHTRLRLSDAQPVQPGRRATALVPDGQGISVTAEGNKKRPPPKGRQFREENPIGTFGSRFGSGGLVTAADRAEAQLGARSISCPLIVIVTGPLAAIVMSTCATSTTGGTGTCSAPDHSDRSSSSVPSQEFVSTSPVTPGQPCGPGPTLPSLYCQSQ